MKKVYRRDFIKHSGLVLAVAAFPPSELWHPGRQTWDAVMAQPWERPARLNSFAGVHPRLFLNKERLERLKRQVQTTHKDIWEMVLEKADRYTAQAPPLDYNQQGPMRELGRGMPWQALAYKITGQSKYLQGAKKWVLEACRLPNWQRNNSLAGGECLFGVAVGYDWLYQDLTPEERTLIREKLIVQGRAMKNGPPQHHDRWLANHNHVEHVGLAAAGLAIFDEVEETTEWIRQSDLVFQTTLKFVSDDGSSNEGHQYWGYTTESLLRYTELARDLMGRDYYDNSWLRSVPDFVIQSTIPDFSARNCVMSFGDSHRDYRSHGPTHILYRLAAEYRNRHAQWLVREMDKRHVGRGDFCTWTNLLWYDDTLAEAPIPNRPTFWNCEDVGWVTMRSGWEDDAVMVGFKCGPMHGHKAQQYYEQQFQEKWPKYHYVGGGHGHPDVNNFQVYAFGKWLAIDPLYETPKWTKTHNTVLVNGEGQLGEGKAWFDRDIVLENKASSRIIKTESQREYDYVVGDAENIYPPSLGLKKFHRHLVYAKPDVILVLDELEAERQARFDWLLNGEESVEKLADTHYLLKTGDVVMDVHFLLPRGLSIEIDGKSLKAAPAATTDSRIVVALHPRKTKDSRSQARMKSDSGRLLQVAVQTAGWNVSIELDAPSKKVKVIRVRS